MNRRGTGFLLVILVAMAPLGGCFSATSAANDERALSGPTVRPLRDPAATPTVTPTPAPTPEPIPEAEPEQLITPLSYGVYHDGAYAAVYVVVHNPSLTRRLDRIRAVMTIYDTTGAALTRAQATLQLLMPNERQAFMAPLSAVPKDRTAGKIDFAFNVGRIQEEDTTAPLRTESARVLQDRTRYQVSGDVVNPYKDQLNDALVVAVAYDSAGAVIGGGSGRVAFVPAEGKAAALVDIRTPSRPARVELFAALTASS